MRRSYAPGFWGSKLESLGTKGQRLAKRCLHLFWGMRRVRKIPLATLLDPGARRIRIINFWVCAGGMRRIYIYICDKISFSLNFLGVCAKVCVSTKSKIPKTCYRTFIRVSNSEVSARVHIKLDVSF